MCVYLICFPTYESNQVRSKGSVNKTEREKGTGNRERESENECTEFKMADEITEKGLGTNFEHSISMDAKCRIY